MRQMVDILGFVGKIKDIIQNLYNHLKGNH